MSEFLYLYRGGHSAESPAQRQQHMQKWMTWLGKLRDEGHVKDMGQPLDGAGKIVTGKQRTVTDGPYAEKDLVGGYTIVEARDISHAVELSIGCPIFEYGGLVEVRPVMKM